MYLYFRIYKLLAISISTSPSDPSLAENSPREALKAKQRARARAQMTMKGMGRH